MAGTYDKPGYVVMFLVEKLAQAAAGPAREPARPGSVDQGEVRPARILTKIRPRWRPLAALSPAGQDAHMVVWVRRLITVR